jgi:hypothetical protein
LPATACGTTPLKVIRTLCGKNRKNKQKLSEIHS